MSRKEKTVYCFVINDLVSDQRVDRTCRALMDLGYRPVLIGRKLKHSDDIERPYSCIRWTFPVNKGPLFYFLMNVKIFWFLCWSQNPSMVIANDVDTLPGSWFGSKLKRIKIIVDCHEWFSQVPELNQNKIKRKIWEWIERLLIPQTDAAITVNEILADIFQQKWKKTFFVIRNAPFYSNDSTLVQKDPALILYQGSVNKDRGVELMIETMQYLPEYKLCIAGDGDILEECKTLTKKLHLQNVVFLGRIAPEKLKSITPKAILGLSWEDDSCANYRYALPNKWFDYIHAHTPVLVSNLPVMAKYTLEYQVGEVVQERNPLSIARQIRDLIENRKDDYLKYMNNCKFAAAQLNYDKEKEKWSQITRYVFKNHRHFL